MRHLIQTIALGAMIAATGLPSPAMARDYYYFHRADVSREIYIADRMECDRLAGGVSPIRPVIPYQAPNPNLTVGQNALATGLASVFAGLMSGAQTRRTISAVERTCMADKGYARYGVDKAVVKDIEKLDRIDARVERYFALATAAQPLGQRIKE